MVPLEIGSVVLVHNDELVEKVRQRKSELGKNDYVHRHDGGLDILYCLERAYTLELL